MPYTGTPEEAGRAFLSENAALFGISQVNDLQLVSDRAALGGHLLRFKQTFNGVDVKDGGIGLVLNANKQVIMASGPYFRDVNVNTTPTLTADAARRLPPQTSRAFRSPFRATSQTCSSPVWTS